MAEESDEALEISSNEESGTDRDDIKESMDQSTSESLQSGSPTVISLLDRLRYPTPADLSRKRHLRQNPPPKGDRQTGKGKEKRDPACERVKSYPNEEFIVRSSKLFCHACKEVLALKKVLSALSYSSTRWWSQFEVIHSMLKTFSDVKKFLERDDLLPATSTKLLQVLDDPAKTRKLKIEIATTVDAMEPFVKATYKLEGDGPLSLEAYQQLSILFSSVSTQHYPNVAAVGKAEANGNASHEQQLLDYSKACVQPAYDYFYLKFNNDLKPVLDAFKVTRLFSPFKFHELKPSATDIDRFKAFPFLSSQETNDGLKMEIPMYMAASENVSTEIDLIAWWKRHAIELPK